MAVGRFAPSPSGPLHLGNLRTALLAWLFARSAGSEFLLRVEDLDPVSSRAEHEASQLADLRAIGLDWDGPIVRQSERRAHHDAAVDALVEAGFTYPCFCTRREISEAAGAPHGQGPDGYPGTCRDLTETERRDRAAIGRPAALRLRTDGGTYTVIDRLHGEVAVTLDDLVLRRNDGVASYNVAVVVDDAAQGVEEVVRGDDLLSATPRQAHLAELLGLSRPTWAHVPLVVGPDGKRLAKRHGAVSLDDLAAVGVGPDQVLQRLAVSLGLVRPGERIGSPVDLLERFEPTQLLAGLRNEV